MSGDLMTHPEHNEKKSVAMSSVIAGAFLTGFKLTVGVATGSIGILSEAAHSALDFVAALVTFLAVRVSDKPADDFHRYGHGKVENLSALIETILLLITCGWIVVEATKRLTLMGARVEPTAWAFGVMALSIVIDFTRSRALARVAKKYSSQALEADALHFRTDIWSSLVVLLGLGLVKLGQVNPDFAALERADAIAALIVALIVVKVSMRLGKRAVEVLLDTAPAGALDQIETAALSVEGVLNCHKVRVRPSGNQSFIDLHVEVDRNLPFERSHEIAEEVERRVEFLIPKSNALVHIDPAEYEKEEIAERIRIVAQNQNMAVHNIRIDQQDNGMVLDLHLEVDDQMSLDDAHALASRLEREVREDQPHVAAITTHIESRSTAMQSAEVLTPEAQMLVKEIEDIIGEVLGAVEVHNIKIRRSGIPNDGAPHENAGLVVSLHCRFDGKTPIGKVHQRCHHIEDMILSRRPHIERVSVHAEPVKRR